MPERRTPTFDPYAILHALERHRVKYVVIGGFARVLQGTEELTRGIDIVPSPRPDNLRRLEDALNEVDARRQDGRRLDRLEAVVADEPVIELVTAHGELKI